MTGIERLRTLAGARDEWVLGWALAEIADQIERELQEERDRWDSELCEAQMDKSRVTVVYLEMNKHVLGHEGMEDSPVARWARELREALGGAVTDKDREAAEWVREHGGIDHVKAEWRSRVPYDRYERRRQRLLDHIAECETALGRRNRRIKELEGRVKALTNENAELRRRAMPEGYEWPTIDGRKVDFKTPYQPSLGVLEAVSIYSNGACEVMSHDGIIKPVSKIHVVVPAADGEPLENATTSAGPFTVREIERSDDPDEPEDIVWYGEHAANGFKVWRIAGQLTHTKPEVDTWQHIEEDAGCTATKYNERRGTIFTTKQQVARDLVRRCRALSDRERGE